MFFYPALILHIAYHMAVIGATSVLNPRAGYGATQVA